MIKKIKFISFSSIVPECPVCGSNEHVIDNGDNWYCLICNVAFND